MLTPGITRLAPITGRFRQRGFTLIEAMVAVVVFSVALIGLAAMYNKSVQISHSAYLRSLASVQALSVTEMVRLAVAEDRLENDGEITLAWSSPVSYSCASADDPDTGSTVLDDELRTWCDTLDTLYGPLLADSTEIVVELEDAGMTGTEDDYVDVDVDIGWTERGAPGGAEEVSFTYEARVQ